MTRDQKKNLDDISQCLMFAIIITCIILSVLVLREINLFAPTENTDQTSTDTIFTGMVIYLIIAALMLYFWVIKPFTAFFKETTWPRSKPAMLMTMTHSVFPWAVILSAVFIAVSVSLEGLERILPKWTELPTLIIMFGVLILTWKWTEAKRKTALEALFA